MHTPSKINVAAWAALLFACSGPGSVLAATAAEPAMGMWQEHRYSFVFMGFTSTYSCDGLAEKLKVLLIAAGARPDARVRPGACPSGFGQPDRFARAELVFHTLTPAADVTLQGSAEAAAEGTWRLVNLAAHRPRELRTGDCELVEQFEAGVLPLFSTRNVQSNVSCVPHQESGSNIDLRFEAFAAVRK